MKKIQSVLGGLLSAALLLTLAGCKDGNKPAASSQTSSDTSLSLQESSQGGDGAESSESPASGDVTSDAASSPAGPSGSTTRTKTQGTSPTGTASKPTQAGATGSRLYDDQPENMGGYTFVLANPWMNRKAGADAGFVERLLHQRIDEVEKEYNCTIRITDFYAGMEALGPKIMAGDKVADVMSMLPEMWIPAAGAGYLRPWNDVFDIIHEDDTRWLPAQMKTRLGGKSFIQQYERPSEGGAIVLWYNKDVLKAAGIKEDPAQLVQQNQWTWEKFREMLIKTTDGKSKFGLGWVDSYADPGRALAVSNGASSVVEKGGSFTTTFTDPKYIAAMNFYDQIVNKDKTMKVYPAMKSETSWGNLPTVETLFTAFEKGNFAFLSGRMWYGTHLKELETLNYGMVVYPKGPSASGYYTHSQTLGGYAMTSTNKDYKKSAKIFNAIARPVKDFEDIDMYESEVLSEFYQKGDTLSPKMLQLAVNNGVLDIGYSVRSLNDALTKAQMGSIFWGTGTVSSSFQTLKGIYDTDVKNVFSKLPK